MQNKNKFCFFFEFSLKQTFFFLKPDDDDDDAHILYAEERQETKESGL